MRRQLLAVPVAAALSLVIAGSALATHCGNDSKRAGAGQHVTLVVDPATGDIVGGTGFNANGGFRGGFVDVYLDLDGSGTATAGDCVIDDTYIISQHSRNGASTGQDDGGLAVLPPVLRGDNPAGSSSGVGFADLLGFCPFG